MLTVVNWPSRPGVAERISQERRGVAVLVSQARMLNGLGLLPLTQSSRRGFSAWISQQAVATHTQRTSGNLEDLHFILLDVVVDRASVGIDNLCGRRYPDDLHVLTTTGAPDFLPLYQRVVCFVHSMRCRVR
jgi:hypothetical protein